MRGWLHAFDKDGSVADVLPWFRFNVERWLSSELVDGMTLEQEGACVRLMTKQWKQGSIPDDREWTARALGVTLEHYEKHIAKTVEAFFPIREEGRRANQNLDAERENSLAFAERQAANGSKGGRPRKQNQEDKTHGLPTGKPNETQTKARARTLSLSVVSSDSVSDPEICTSNKPSDARTHVGEVDPLGKPDNAKQRAMVRTHEQEARRLLALLSATRRGAGISNREITARYASLAGIASRLDAGCSPQDVEHVIAVYAAEVRSGNAESAKYFDHVSPFRPENFERALAKTPTQARASPGTQTGVRQDLGAVMRQRLASE